MQCDPRLLIITLYFDKQADAVSSHCSRGTAIDLGDSWLILLKHFLLALINLACNGGFGACGYTTLRVFYVFYVLNIWFFESVLIFVGFYFVMQSMKVLRAQKN